MLEMKGEVSWWKKSLGHVYGKNKGDGAGKVVYNFKDISGSKK